jgi:hypothetical protein
MSMGFGRMTLIKEINAVGVAGFSVTFSITEPEIEPGLLW